MTTGLIRCKFTCYILFLSSSDSKPILVLSSLKQKSLQNLKNSGIMGSLRLTRMGKFKLVVSYKNVWMFRGGCGVRKGKGIRQILFFIWLSLPISINSHSWFVLVWLDNASWLPFFKIMKNRYRINMMPISNEEQISLSVIFIVGNWDTKYY